MKKAPKGFRFSSVVPKASAPKHWAKLVSPNISPSSAPASGPISIAPITTGIVSSEIARTPIRRYPDTAIHRILSDLVKGVPVSKIQKKYTEFAADAASESSQCEVRAMRAERDAEKCYMAEYMTQHIGEEYDGIISGTTARGIFVELANGVEGFVNLEYFPECRFHFDGLTTHTDEISGRQLTIGGALRIQVAAADVATGMIDFVPAEKG
nr:S1 RNA-binding domain-containing protein [uncultured Subdoligranulum sp.]